MTSALDVVTGRRHRWSKVGRAKSPVPRITIRVGGAIEESPPSRPTGPGQRPSSVRLISSSLGYSPLRLGLAEIRLEFAELALDRRRRGGADQVDEELAAQVVGLVLKGAAEQVVGIVLHQVRLSGRRPGA